MAASVGPKPEAYRQDSARTRHSAAPSSQRPCTLDYLLTERRADLERRFAAAP
jgi:hypothetical protein